MGKRSTKSIEIRALKADGKPYRWWHAEVESTSDDSIVTRNNVGDIVEATNLGGWTYRHNIRNIYWFGRPYNLSEVYEPCGGLKQLYVHIASVPRVEDNILTYIDRELDVIKRPGRPPRVADADEFAAAAVEFNYPPDLQAACWWAVEEAIELVRYWRPLGSPVRSRGRFGPNLHVRRRLENT